MLRRAAGVVSGATGFYYFYPLKPRHQVMNGVRLALLRLDALLRLQLRRSKPFSGNSRLGGPECARLIVFGSARRCENRPLITAQIKGFGSARPHLSTVDPSSQRRLAYSSNSCSIWFMMHENGSVASDNVVGRVLSDQAPIELL